MHGGVCVCVCYKTCIYSVCDRGSIGELGVVRRGVARSGLVGVELFSH